jgi:hypothetical protein
VKRFCRDKFDAAKQVGAALVSIGIGRSARGRRTNRLSFYLRNDEEKREYQLPPILNL